MGMFAAKSYDDDTNIWTTIDSCILEIPGTKGSYIVICAENPLELKKTSHFSWYQLKLGILADISRVIIARQTERALRYQILSIATAAVRCDAKTKQWKTAYSRRHLAEKFFDVVTFDIGSQRTKFTASGSSIECLFSLNNALKYFWGAAKRYRPHYLLGD